ncbi:hypothetical protein EYV94_09195 [Puteibacter caeruleilacunae]|nr:hypothetical protein EYV94_09195 [Puteibacter caeruleilacunae]
MEYKKYTIKTFIFSKIILTLILVWGNGDVLAQTSGDELPQEVKWMYDEAKWGISHHYLAGGLLDNAYYQITDFDQWNYYITNFDVDAYAQLVDKLGAGYVIFTLTQNRGYICTYSKVWDEHSPEFPGEEMVPGGKKQLGTDQADYTPDRDLLGDLARALKKKGIKTIAYIPAHVGDRWTGKQVGPPQYPDWYLNDFLRELACRWGSDVAGWWFDGYWPISSEEQKTDYPIATKILNSIRSGNPNTIMALNAGVGRDGSPDKLSQYSPGEANELPPLPLGRAIKGKGEKYVQHVGWTFLSKMDPVFAGWGEIDRNLRFEDDVVASHTVKVREKGGVSTWDVAINPDGSWALAKIKQVQTIGNKIGTSNDTTYSDLRLVNDNDPDFRYKGNWNYSQNRKTGAYNQDVHYTTEDGDSFSYVFTGKSIVFATSKAPDQGDVEIFLDNKSVGVFSTHDKYRRQVQTIIYENHNLKPGAHILKVAKISGDYMLVDLLGIDQ